MVLRDSVKYSKGGPKGKNATARSEPSSSNRRATRPHEEGKRMRRVLLRHADLVVTSELVRSRGSVLFEERLKASIEQIGLAEPIKVTPLPEGKYLVIDGVMRLKAISGIRATDPTSF